MKKILYVASVMSHINNFHLPYIERLRSEGYSVSVMAKGKGADFDIPFEKRMFSLKNLLLLEKIRKIVREGGFDCIILNTSLAAFWVRCALSKKDRPRVVNIVHGYLFSESYPRIINLLLLLAEKINAQKTDSLIVMNREDLAIAEDKRLSGANIRLIRGMGASLPVQGRSAQSVRILTKTEGKFLLGFAGEITERKNQRFLLCAAAELKLFIPRLHLMLIGGGKRDFEMRLAKKLGISDSVSFLGQRNDACDFIRAVDVYVSASFSEGMPFNIIEALGCKRTVLCSDVKGHRDLIEDGVSGFLFRVSDMNDFVSKVKMIWEGKLSVSKDAAFEVFLKHSFDSVFDDTYRTLKEEIRE